MGGIKTKIRRVISRARLSRHHGLTAVVAAATLAFSGLLIAPLGLATMPAGTAEAAGSATQALAAGFSHTSETRSDGTLWAWGNNTAGQLGVGDRVSLSYPTQVTNPTTWAMISAGWTHTLGIRPDGTLWAWGDNSYYQLGLGHKFACDIPTQVGQATNWVAVAAGFKHSLALRSDGTLWAWGYNFNGECGISDPALISSPLQIGSAKDWAAIAAGHDHSLGLRSDGSLWSWGDNYWGQLGLGDTTDREAPARVGSGNTWVSVAAGSYHSLALRSDHTLWAWGQNVTAQLGVGDVINRDVPVQLDGSNWTQVSGGTYHNLGLRSDGTLWAWGDNKYGQLGLGDTTRRSEPTQVGVQKDWAIIGAGGYHSLGSRLDGSLWSWGWNYYGQLGLGDTSNRYSPTCVSAGSTEPPSVSTSSATYVTANSARLNGSLSSLGTANAVNVSFQYGTSSGSYTSETTAQARTSTGAFYFNLSGLNPGTTYYFRAKAVGDGTSYGSQMTFTTSTASTTPPSVSTSSATSVTASSARLNGSLSSLGTASTVNVSFQYGTSSGSYSGETTAQARTSTGTFYCDISGLNPGTTYYFRAKAVGDGTTYGTQMSFTTSAASTEPPSVSTLEASDVASTSATLNGNLASLGTDTIVWVSFYYGTATDSYTSTTPWQSHTSTGTFSFDLTGLNPGTTYYFKARAIGDGIAYGVEMSLTTSAGATTPPSVSTSSATYVTTSSARLNGSLSSLGTANAVNVSFQWGTVSGSYTNETTVQARTSTGTFYYNLFDLNPGTTYYFRAKAVGDGTSYGAQMTFNTGATSTAPPSVSTSSANYVTASSARLNGSLSSLGTATTVSVSFQYGTVSGSYANESTVQARTSTGSFYFNLSGLNPGTTYYFRAKAVGDGTSYGSQMSFTTETASGSQDTTPPSVTVLAPNGKEKVKAYSSTDIQWTALDNVGVTSVDIYYSIDGGSTYDAIALGESNDGVYAWTVPDTSSPKCVVKVVARDAAGNVGEDMSDGTFQIQTSKEDLLSNTAKAGIAAAGMGLIGITALAAKKRLR